ncbi:MAG TPA: ATP-binding protein [Thermoanaerobaculia bacterium]|nr:ATP-binding protein [Thermoanaerobaculia bacterium]
MLAANTAFAELVGRRPVSLKAAHLIDFIDADERNRVRERLRSLRSSDRGLQMEIRLLNGEERRVLLIARRSGRSARAPLLAYFVSLREITNLEDDRSELLDVIERAAWEWRRTFDAVETPIVIIGLESLITRINRAARMLVGKQYGEIVGRSLHDLPVTEPWLSMIDLTKEVQQRRSPVARQVKDSYGRTLDLLAMLFNAEDASDERVIVIVWDVSALVDLQTRLEQQRTMATMGALVGGVAHEVRNPLFAISATIDAMEQASDGSLKEYFEVLREEIDRMTRLMQDLLAYGRPAAPVFAAVSVGEIIDTAARNCSPVAKRQSVQLKRVIRANPTIVADRERLDRALQNLIENAIQHSQEQETVTIQCSTRSKGRTRYVDIAVADRGRGFSAEDLPRIFEPFFSRRKGGTGLGLALVQQIVQEHGGEVVAANRSGGGAEVKISIPLPRE